MGWEGCLAKDHTFFPTPFPYQGTVNTSLRHKFGIPSCPQPGEQVRKRCPTTACSPVPRISSPSWYFQLWSSTHIQWSKVDRYISGRNSIRSNSNSFLPPILIICNRHSLTKLILITQLTQLIQLTKLTLNTQLIQLTVTHSIHPNHSTNPTHQTNRPSLTKFIPITQLTKLTLITQLSHLTKLTFTHSTHPNHATHPTHQTD